MLPQHLIKLGVSGSVAESAIAVDRRWPEVRTASASADWRPRIGTRNSLAQYLAGQLSRRIKTGDLTTVEGFPN